ncbi:Calx-beta domain-containing protein [Nocardioides sp. BP30]|uniref:Calx-beta domain-containing protein n=1 Tax=Nocardioides sp. BP30 TaxID=3036374 RepID=UPI002469B9DF|nr:Calx-beta domain-containing protein [Nocardioides sp. BP30]WGL50322.1 Calx-beta domain-containing protein [Nocardioides sp. BP30]
MTTLTRAAAITATTALLAGGTVAVIQTSSDAAPKGSTSTGVTVTEGGWATVTVTLRKPATKTLRLTWKTVNGTATGKDFKKVKAAHLVFSRGQIAATVAVKTRDDTKVESTESFWVKFSGKGIKLDKKRVMVSITDNDSTSVSGSASASPTGTVTTTLSPAPQVP